MIIYSLKHTENTLNSILQSNSGVIHSVFKSTINLLVDHELISLYRMEDGYGPRSLVLDYQGDLTGLNLQPRDSFQIDNKELQFSNLVINLSFSRSISLPKITKITNRGLYKSYITEIKNICHLYNFKDSILNTDRFSDFYKQIREAGQNYNAILTAMATHIGWGIGLTPSVDDFIVGFVFALKLFGGIDIKNSVDALSAAAFINSFSHTTDVSKYFLFNAFNGMFSEYLYEISKAFESENDTEIINAFLRLLSKGNTSGIDCFSGLCFVSDYFNFV